MHTLSKKKLRDFWERHPDAQTSLASWYRLMEKGVVYGKKAKVKLLRCSR